MALLVYVDDIILASNDTQGTQSFKRYLHAYFSIKDLGTLKYFLGIEVARGLKGCFYVKESILWRSLMSVDC